MSYLFQAILFVLALAGVMMAEAFWSGLNSEQSLTRSLCKSFAAGSGFVIYAVADFLMLVPGADYVIAGWL